MLSLRNEAMVYKKLRGKKGFPKLYWYGKYGHYNVMVTEKMGANLKEL